MDDDHPATLAGYRLYIMDDGHIRAALEFQATSDRLAIEHANQVRKGRSAELWRRARQVRCFEITARDDA